LHDSPEPDEQQAGGHGLSSLQPRPGRDRKDTVGEFGRQVSCLNPGKGGNLGVETWRSSMKAKSLTIPEIGLIAGTRGALGAGAALLLADRLSRDQRRAVGWTLFLVGVITTFPLL